MEDQEAYRKAKHRVEAKIGFYVHLAVYGGVNILLVIVNLATTSDYLWFRWPMMGWGIGLLFHGLGVFVFSGRKIREIKDKMIEKEMKKGAH